MKENQPAAQRRQAVPQIIMMSNMRQLMPQNISQLIAIEMGNHFRGQQNVTPQPVAGSGRTQLRYKTEFTVSNTQLEAKPSKE
jgi:hypothetical protein